ncbi:MAG: hypothetical protein AUK47_17765 [Deltaproteobacteria bacterium CG2_30_63_29]|nr:MAG: hypothetical protein AUK47_17765 [Deltaproteobacteria bacterium CG2_30_63_29]
MSKPGRQPGPQSQKATIRARLAQETGTIYKQARHRVALIKPSPYFVGMSSLGFQQIYKLLNALDDVAAERSFLPDVKAFGALLSYENQTPVGDMDVLAFSVAYELEITGLIACLEQAGLPPFARDRGDDYPLVLVGGPLTFSNPLPVAPFADVIVMGEGEEVTPKILVHYREATSLAQFYDAIEGLPGVYLPVRMGERFIDIAKVDNRMLPAASCIRTPDTELSDMHLVEAERGCHRKCTFCVMRRSTNGGMRVFSPERILSTIPADATKVGLVGAAVTDHPDLLEIVGTIVGDGRRCSLSSLRADRLTPELCALLLAGGLKSITVASDGASERLRHALMKNIKEKHLLYSAELAREHKLKLKLYQMVGLPTETDDDIDEMIDLTRRMADRVKVSVGISPFVPKRNTPMDGDGFAGIKPVEATLERIRKGLKGIADIRSTSARWAWVEYKLAQGGFKAGEAAYAAYKGGEKFSDWKKAFEAD